MKKELSISERGDISQKLIHPDHFYTDAKLYNQHFAGSKLSATLTKVNEHNIGSLHSRMLYDLLAKVSEQDVLNNRTEVAPVDVTPVDVEVTDELKSVKEELEETKDELETVQSDLDDATETIETLEAEKKSEITNE